MSPRVRYGAAWTHGRALLRVLQEVRGAADDKRSLLVAGARPAAELAEALAEGGETGAVKTPSGRAPSEAELEVAALLVYVVDPKRSDPAETERTLRRADRHRIPAVCVLVGDAGGDGAVPYVLATDILRVPAGVSLPLEEIAALVAERAEDDGWRLAARLPVLRRPVCDVIVRRYSRLNGIVGAAVFVPGADLPVITLNQLRMVLRIAAANGVEVDRELALELLAVVTAGLGLRALARELAALAPGVGWAAKGAVAYAGTRALGEAAVLRYAKNGY